MFSEEYVSHSVHGRGSVHPPPVPTSSGGHCSGRYALYWNAFWFKIANSGVKENSLNKNAYQHCVAPIWYVIYLVYLTFQLMAGNPGKIS